MTTFFETFATYVPCSRRLRFDSGKPDSDHPANAEEGDNDRHMPRDHLR